MKPPPLQFIDLSDQHNPLNTEVDNASWAIRDPTITIAKVNGRIEVAARFNLEVKPYPVYSRTKNKSWHHARYIEMIRLRYHVVKREEVNFDPDTSPEDDFKFQNQVTSSNTVGGTVGVSGTVPNANVNVSIVRGGQVQISGDLKTWICNAGYEPQNAISRAADAPQAILISASQTSAARRYFVWEWISNLETPIVPDTAFRGKKIPVTVTRVYTTEQFMPEDKWKKRNEANKGPVLKEMSEKLGFKFDLEIMVRELGKGGFRARLQKLRYLWRPKPQPRDAYKPNVNMGIPLSNPRTATSDQAGFLIPNQSTPFVTSGDLESIEKALKSGTGDTASLQDAKKQIASQFIATGIMASHISTYADGEATPDQKNLIKATFVSKNW